MLRNVPTLTDLRNEVRKYLNDPSGGIWTDARINTEINRSIHRVLIDTEWEVDRAGVGSVPAHKFFVNIPSAALLILGMRQGTDTKAFYPTSLIQLDKEEPGWETSGSGTPIRFVMFDQQRVIIWPPPSATTTLYFEYIPLPTPLVTSDASDFGGGAIRPPQEIADLVPLDTASVLWLRQDWRQSQKYERLYQQQLESVKVRLRRESDAGTLKLRPSSKGDKAYGSLKFRR